MMKLTNGQDEIAFNMMQESINDVINTIEEVSKASKKHMSEGQMNLYSNLYDDNTFVKCYNKNVENNLFLGEYIRMGQGNE